MPDEAPKTLEELEVDENNLYREETFTDLKVASIRRLEPVKPDGSPDAARRPVFVAQTQLMSQVGPLPVQTVIEASDLREALAKFPEAINRAVNEMMEEARELRRREASRIVVPEAGFDPNKMNVK